MCGFSVQVWKKNANWTEREGDFFLGGWGQTIRGKSLKNMFMIQGWFISDSGKSLHGYEAG